jgi:asparagine synthase (glutamine-hydrolysing)
MESLLVDVAAELGINTILSGGGSEFITEGNHYYLADLLHQGQIKQALQEASHWSEAKSQSLWSILYGFGLKPLFPIILQKSLSPLWRQGYGTFPKLGEFDIPPWIKRDFANTYHLWDKSQATLQQMYQYPVADSVNQLNLATASGNWASWYLASSANMQISKPFLDPRLISYCLSLPLALREVPNTPKPLLQAAMKGILPDEIRTRRNKCHFNEVYWKGLRQNLAYLEDMVAQSSFQSLYIFDHSQLLTALQQHSLGLGDVKQGSRLAVALALIAWYDQNQD